MRRFSLNGGQLLVGLALTAVLVVPAIAAASSRCAVTFDARGRRQQARTAVPKVIRTLLPQRGMYVAGGGLVSGAWRIVLDLDRAQLWVGRNPAPNARSFGKMPKVALRHLSCQTLRRLVRLADASWREVQTIPSHPTVDYGEVVVIADSATVRFIDGYGPIRTAKTKALIDALRQAAQIDRL